jgi:hypothetical protein
MTTHLKKTLQLSQLGRQGIGKFHKNLKGELRLTNEHFYDLLGRAQKGPEPDYANEFDHAASELIRKFEEAWKVLSERAQIRIPQNFYELEHQIKQHKDFEDNLQVGIWNSYNIKFNDSIKKAPEIRH